MRDRRRIGRNARERELGPGLIIGRLVVRVLVLVLVRGMSVRKELFHLAG
jgi:hypothetical protein